MLFQHCLIFYYLYNFKLRRKYCVMSNELILFIDNDLSTLSLIIIYNDMYFIFYILKAK